MASQQECVLGLGSFSGEFAWFSHEPKTLLVSLIGDPILTVGVILCMLSFCVALWRTGYLSRVYFASQPMIAGIDFSHPPFPAWPWTGWSGYREWIDGWMSRLLWRLLTLEKIPNGIFALHNSAKMSFFTCMCASFLWPSHVPLGKSCVSAKQCALAVS